MNYDIEKINLDNDTKKVIESLPEEGKGYFKIIVTKFKKTYSSEYEYILKIFKKVELINSIYSETSIYNNCDIYDYADEIANEILEKYQTLSIHVKKKKYYKSDNYLILIIAGGYK